MSLCNIIKYNQNKPSLINKATVPHPSPPSQPPTLLKVIFQAGNLQPVVFESVHGKCLSHVSPFLLLLHLFFFLDFLNMKK